MRWCITPPVFLRMMLCCHSSAYQIRTSAVIIAACHLESSSNFTSLASLLHTIKPAWSFLVRNVLQCFSFAISLSSVSQKRLY